jgi:hypothetical protein
MLDSDQFYTIQFVRDVNNAVRRIHSLLKKKGRSGEELKWRRRKEDTLKSNSIKMNMTNLPSLNGIALL